MKAKPNAAGVMCLLLKLACLFLIVSFSPHREIYAVTPSPGYGIFRGVIVDVKGKRITGARVVVVGRDGSQDIKPNRYGYFEITLPAGTYEITVTKEDFASYTITHLEVTDNTERSYVFRLEPLHGNFQYETPSLKLAHKQNGILVNFACQTISGAYITLANKRTSRTISTGADGKFVIDLPAGNYVLSIAIDGRKKTKPHKLWVQRANNGDVHLLVNTGIESTCPCFGLDVEDLLIREEPVVINPQIVLRKPLPKP